MSSDTTNQGCHFSAATVRTFPLRLSARVACMFANTTLVVQKLVNEDMWDSGLAADMSLISACFADTRTAVNCFVVSPN